MTTKGKAVKENVRTTLPHWQDRNLWGFIHTFSHGDLFGEVGLVCGLLGDAMLPEPQ